VGAGIRCRVARGVADGFGYSLVFPGFGVEAIHREPPQNRGLAMGADTAFLDMALGVGSPALGLIASGAGLRSVFFASTVSVLCAAGVAIRLMSRNGNWSTLIQGQPNT
jgi:predicted MFS family arabinose efflux permease